MVKEVKIKQNINSLCNAQCSSRCSNAGARFLFGDQGGSRDLFRPISEEFQTTWRAAEEKLKSGSKFCDILAPWKGDYCPNQQN